jgi:hypothetical protein
LPRPPSSDATTPFLPKFRDFSTLIGEDRQSLDRGGMSIQTVAVIVHLIEAISDHGFETGISGEKVL